MTLTSLTLTSLTLTSLTLTLLTLALAFIPFADAEESRNVKILALVGLYGREETEGGLLMG